MGRTVETARILARPHGAEVRVEAESALREIDYGHWEGKTRAEVEDQNGDEYDNWQEDPLTIAPRDGESGVQVLARALLVVRRIVEQHDQGSVLVVCNKGTNRLLISSLLGFDARGYRDRLDQSPAALNILDFVSPVRARLRLLNDVSHSEGVPGRTFSQRLSRWWSPHS